MADEISNCQRILTELVLAGNRFRRTPIVDDDFPAIRNEFDRVLKQADEFLKDKENADGL